MIFINKNSANIVILTLTEKTTLSPVNYLFNFKSHSSNREREYNFLISDLSTATTRYNKFIIDENVNTLDDLGWYSYKVYEQASAINLDPSLALNIVETGLCFVSASTQSVIYNDDNPNSTFLF